MVRFGLADTRSGRLRGVFLLGLDAQSLRLRTIQLMLPEDPALAREMFSSLPRQEIPQYDCRDRLVDNPQLYYETLALLAKRSFAPANIRREAHIVFVVAHVEELTSPVQVVPLAQALLSLELNDESFAA